MEKEMEEGLSKKTMAKLSREFSKTGTSPMRKISINFHIKKISMWEVSRFKAPSTTTNIYHQIKHFQNKKNRNLL